MNPFTKHPHSVGESYFEHLKFASAFGINLLVGGLACLIHAVFPFLLQKTGSNYLLKMTHLFVERMPNVENRVVDLSQSIENKIKAQKI
jgi:hypothetical protein